MKARLVLRGDAPRRSALAGVLVACAVAAACSDSPKSGSHQWRHGVVEAKSDAGFVFMASHRGFGAKQGLQIQMVQFKGDALALKALLAGEIESYEGSPGGPMAAASRSADVKLVGCVWPGLTYGIFSKSSINSPEDLKGKSIAISSPGALPDLIARAVLEKYNISTSDVQIVSMGSDVERFKALVAGVVDAVAASSEMAPAAASNGLKLLVHAQDVAPQYLRFCTYMSTKTLTTKREEAVRFLAAEMAAYKYALSHRDEVLTLTQEVTGVGVDDQRAAYIFDEAQRHHAIDPQMTIPLDKLEWLQTLLVRTGNLSKPFDVSTMVDGSVRDDALKLVSE